MVRVEISKASDFVGVRLHPCNIAEIKALCLYEPDQALRQLSKWTYPKSYTVRDGDTIISFCGIDLKGQIWLFFTDIESLPLSFFKAMKKLLDDTGKEFPYMQGMIYGRNLFALRFAKFIHARISDPIEFGIDNELFYKFEIGGM